MCTASNSQWWPDVASDGSGGAYIALSSPTRVLHVVRGREEPEFWHATGDETLVAAILPDSVGGLYMGLSPDGRLIHAGAPGVARELADTGAIHLGARGIGGRKRDAEIYRFQLRLSRSIRFRLERTSQVGKVVRRHVNFLVDRTGGMMLPGMSFE